MDAPGLYAQGAEGSRAATLLVVVPSGRALLTLATPTVFPGTA